MKKLFFIWLFTCSFSGYGQDSTRTINDILKYSPPAKGGCVTGIAVPQKWIDSVRNIGDTLRCTLFVYYAGATRSIVHTMPGFVVTRWNKDNVYLDDRKRRLKGLEVLTFKLK